MVDASFTTKRGDGWVGSASVIEPSPLRVVPACAHFGVCGGCTLQQWDQRAYLDWKSGMLSGALRRAGFEPPDPMPMVATQPASRRRMDLALRRTSNSVVIGLHTQRSAAIVDLTECHVLHPALFALVAPLRQILRGLSGFKKQGSAVVNLLDTGADILLRTDAALNATDRTRLAAFAEAHGIPRITHAVNNDVPEPVCALRPATTSLSGVTVAPPPGAFLQASAAGETAILAAVMAGLPAKLPARARIADLYAGCGTLSFPLSEHGRVAAYEGDAAAHAALRRAAGSLPPGRVDAFQRDLVRQPLNAKELSGFAVVVVDPPHAGAAVQIALIAEAAVARVIYVSCNPAALARDAATLRMKGYKLLSATAIDQFLWSARLESVCVFAR